MKSRGFVLVELLVALMLFSLAGSSLYVAFVQGLRAQQRFSQEQKLYDPLRIFFLRFEEDLRNSVTLKDYPFEGKKEEISFPVLLGEEDRSGSQESKLFMIRYFIKGHNLLREKEELTAALLKPEPTVKEIIKDLGSADFEFPYKNTGGDLTFESFWIDDPFLRIPRGVRIHLTKEGISLTKTVSIPQGRFGYLPDEAGRGENLNVSRVTP